MDLTLFSNIDFRCRIFRLASINFAPFESGRTCEREEEE
jgi:hypothetical protein